MKPILHLALAAIISSCASWNNFESYEVPQFLTVSHKDAMNEKFKSKKDVFTEFGAADKKDQLDNSEVWTYNLAQRTFGSGTTVEINNGNIRQNINNSNLKPIDRSIETSNTIVSSSAYGSTTRSDYVTFWFENDSVIKWESLGYNISYNTPNPNFDEVKHQKYLKDYAKFKRQLIVIPFGFFFGVLLLVTGY